jgi:Ser/Thr protein kinase RdoA (MazF antagonist)
MPKKHTHSHPANPHPPSPHPYERLTPDLIIEAVESLGWMSDGRILSLNSYENRVYQLGIEDAAPLIVKFYRPGRWSDAAIHEEHRFALELASAEIPVVPPLLRDGRSLFEFNGFRFAVFERHGGRWPELNSKDERIWMGRFMGRIHVIGRSQTFQHRERIEIGRLGDESREYLLEHDWLPAHLEEAYESLTGDLLDRIAATFDDVGPLRQLRLHGDCHRGNVLWTDGGPHFVDLDDCSTGPAIQDLWMLIAGSRHEMGEQLADLLQGYTQFCTFEHREIALIEGLRTLRMIHYSAWLARRWEDPAFPQAFPWFEEPRYWEGHVLALREQLAAIDEGPIDLP